MISFIKNFVAKISGSTPDANPAVLFFFLVGYIFLLFALVISLFIYDACRLRSFIKNKQKENSDDKDFYWDKNGYRCNINSYKRPESPPIK